VAYKPILEQIIPRLWVGDEEAVPEANRRNYSILAACKDGSSDCHRAVLKYSSLAAPHDANYYFYRSDKKHLALNLIDSEDVNFIPDEAINAGLRFIKERYDAGDKVFVHCISGHSRSTTLALMFLRAIGEMPYTFKRAEHIFKTLYSHYDPGKGMRDYARNHWEELPTFFSKGK
jgi:hypothetical protein